MITTNDVSELLSSESLEDKILGLILLDSSDDWEDPDDYLSSYDKEFKSMADMILDSYPVVISKERIYILITRSILRAKKNVHVVFANRSNGWNIIYTDDSIKLIEQ